MLNLKPFTTISRVEAYRVKAQKSQMRAVEEEAIPDSRGALL